jgi:hypothetical protein
MDIKARKEKLHAAVAENQGNLWRWSRDNPYKGNPLLLLGFQRVEKVQGAKIQVALATRLKKARLTGEKEKEEGTPLSQLAQMLMVPASRVIAELMRVPPVALSKEDKAGLPSLGQFTRKNKPALPDPDELDLNSDPLGELLLDFLTSRADDGLAGVPEVELGVDPEFDRPNHVGITFPIRSAKAGSGAGEPGPEAAETESPLEAAELPVAETAPPVSEPEEADSGSGSPEVEEERSDDEQQQT